MRTRDSQRWLLANSSVVGFGVAAVVAAETGGTGTPAALAAVALGAVLTATTYFLLSTAYRHAVRRRGAYTDGKHARARVER